MTEFDFSTLIGLVEHYSPSGSEEAAASWLVKHMSSLGFEASLDEVGNALGVMGTGNKQVILLGHIDTVPGEIPVQVENEILFGRGSVDAKGPLACFVDAVAQVGVLDGWQFVVIGAVDGNAIHSERALWWININQISLLLASQIIGIELRWAIRVLHGQILL